MNRGGREALTSQIFVSGEVLNKQDMVLGGLRDPYDRELVTTEFKPLQNSNIGELAARLDIVLGAR